MASHVLSTPVAPSIVAVCFKPLFKSHRMLVLTVLLCVSVISPVIGIELQSFNYRGAEEHTRFAFRRCQNNSMAGEELISLWNKWQLPNNKKTHCYIKCFLYKLGFINLKHMGLSEEKLLPMLKSRSQFQLNDILESESISYEDTYPYNVFEPLDGTCESYYKAWLLVLDQYGVENIQNEFVRLKDEKYTKSKKYGQRALDFCNQSTLKLTAANRFNTSTEATNYEAKCIYQYFHFIDAYGRVDVREIFASYSEAQQSSQELGSKGDGENDNEYRVQIEKCAHHANQLYYQGLCLVAAHLHKCLMEKVKRYKNVFKYRDKLTAFY